jgi:hypothetical protein
MQSTFQNIKDLKIIRGWILFFIIGLFISGLTAIPVEAEISILSRLFSPDTSVGHWLDKIEKGVNETGINYPFLFYGYDWLAFAHFLFSILFIGAYREPVKNKWLIEFGLYACILVIPFAMIAGHFRGIPFLWRLVDCSFGIIGMIPLSICYKRILKLERLTRLNHAL